MATALLTVEGSLQGSGVCTMGIDPGSRIAGFGVLRGEAGRKPDFVAAGAIALTAEKDPYQRLATLYHQITDLIARYQPSRVAIESPFCGENAQSMLKLGRAQGVAIAAIIATGLPVQEYAPRKVKLAACGSGTATKETVRHALQLFFPSAGLDQLRYMDATDALAVALCHHYQGARVSQTGRTSWRAYAERHIGRVHGLE